MALTSIIRDFAVRAGLIVEGTASVTSATGMTGTLQVNGGAAIAKNLIVGETAQITGDTTLQNNLSVSGAAFLTGVTATGAVSISTNTQANTGGAGALQVTGGAYLGNNLVINSAAASTTTVASNALYVNGGAGIKGSLRVEGDAIFTKDVIFAGTTTYVYSTNTVYTDNFVDLHVPSDSSLVWTVDDGKDIGFIFNYYNGNDKNGFLGLDSDSRYLEWFSDGVETAGTFTGGVYGTFRTGSAKLVDATASAGTDSGALTVVGGVGVGGALSVGGDASAATVKAGNLTQGRVVVVGASGQLIDDPEFTYDVNTNQLTATVSNANTATNLAGGLQGGLPYQTAPGTTTFLPIGTAGLILISNGTQPTWATTGSIVAGAAFTATNLFFGQQYQIPFQTGPGATTFEDNFKYVYDTDTLVTVNGQFTGTTESSSISSGALQVSGGVGIAKNLFVGGSETVVGNIFVNGGTLGTNQTTFNLVNSTATTVNLAGAATTVNIGAASGTTEIKNNTLISQFTAASSTASGALQVRGGVGIGGSVYVGNNLDVAGGTIQSSAASFNLLNANVTTANVLGAGTAITIGAATGFTAIRNQTTVTNTTGATSTASGALRVAGGVGIGENLYVGGSANISGTATLTGDLAVNGGDITTTAATFNLVNTNATTVNFAGAATLVRIGDGGIDSVVETESQLLVRTTATVLGFASISKSTTIGEDLSVGGDVWINGGDVYTSQTTFNLVNTTATTVNFAGAGTAITIGAQTGATTIRNQVNVTSSTVATSAASGALVVTGGVGVGQNVWVGQSLRVIGASTLANVSAAVTTATNLTVTNDATVDGILIVNSTQNSNSLSSGAIRTAGGAAITKDVTVGGAITVGVTAAATPNTVVPAIYSNNLLMATFTSGAIAGNSQVDLDAFSSSVYRSARYFVQIVDGANVHISEISLFHDGVKAYINEYGIATNNGQLGSFDATLGGGNVTVKFTPTAASSMIIKMVRIGVTL